MKNMKIAFALLTGLVSSSALAGNSYAPTLNNVVVLHDRSEGDYSPFLYHTLIGEVSELDRDASCVRVEISQNKYVNCISSSRQVRSVGTLAQPIGNVEEWTKMSVHWTDRVEIIEKKTSRGVKYSLRVKY